MVLVRYGAASHNVAGIIDPRRGARAASGQNAKGAHARLCLPKEGAQTLCRFALPDDLTGFIDVMSRAESTAGQRAQILQAACCVP